MVRILQAVSIPQDANLGNSLCNVGSAEYVVNTTRTSKICFRSRLKADVAVEVFQVAIAAEAGKQRI